MKQVVALVVNGTAREVAIRPGETLLDLVRDELRLTGTKRGCELGDCGACTVLLDEQPVNSCLILALEADGGSVVTIEGLARGGDLHPVQKAFVEHGAIQCGFCTPGMILKAAALLAANLEPGRREIQAALAGNLCRCTGYTKILEAVAAASRPQQAGEPERPGPSPGRSTGDLAIVGRRLPKIDAPAKATGRARFTDDIVLPDMIYGKLLLSPVPHALIRSVDVTAAAALPGVEAVLTGADVPDVLYGTSPPRYDEYVLAKEKVRYVGDPVAAVAAVDEETCYRALERIEVEYEELPAVFEPFEAMAEGAPRLFDDRFERNVNTRVDHHFGDVERGFAEADLVREARFVGNRTYQNPLEPHCAIAEWTPHGKVVLYTSTQVVHYVHHQLARILGVPLGDIRVVMENCGGGFGAKAATNPLEIVSILLARASGRPVKMRFDRREMYLYGRGRHEQTIDLEIGVTNDGRITAVRQQAVLEGGAYSSFGVVTAYYAGAMLPTLYKIPNYKYDGYRVNTNLPPCGAMRGHGCPHPRFAFESLLTMIADDLGLDPIEIRLRNAMEPETRTCNDLDIHSCEFKACLRQVRERSGWDAKKGKLPRGRGIGVGCGGFVSGAGYPIYRSRFPHSNALIKVEEDGSKAVLFTGEADIGQGSDTVLGQIAAEAMGISHDRIELVSADSDVTPLGLGAYSSRVTLMGGNAARMAGEEIRRQVLEAAGKILGIPPERLEARDNRVFAGDDPARAISWPEAAAACFSEGGPLVGKGHYSPPEGLGGSYKGAAVGTSPAYSFSAAVCEVEVDLATGKVRVLDFWDAHDCGVAINPMAVEGQVEGAVLMGLGETLLEREEFDRAGRLLNADLHNYLMATSMDAPMIHSSLVESFEPCGPFGAKEVGEGATLPVAGAIANAIADAIGARIFDLPITPEKVLRAIRQGGSAP